MRRLLVGVVCSIGCAVAVAALASAERAPGGGVDHLALRSGPPPARRPRITLHPARTTLSRQATFGFRLPRGRGRFLCRLDGEAARRCRSPLRIQKLGLGPHRFSVRVIGGSGRRGAAARFRWEVVEPMPFGVSTDADLPRALYPGAVPIEIPLRITNPNPGEIRVVSLQVEVTQSPTGCDAAENLVIRPSSASESAPLEVPAGATVAVPGGGASAPAIGLLDLPKNQDACQGGRFSLHFEGLAHG